MKLGELCGGIGALTDAGSGDPEITDLVFDSRKAAPGCLFFCVVGMSSDGHEFAPVAVEAGAAALVVERPLGLGVPEVLVGDARAAMAPLAQRFFGDPTATLALAAVTGTNGKTTTAFLTRSILEAAGIQCGLLGTIRQIVGGETVEAVRTTPEAIDLQRTFAAMLAAGDGAASVEISSHALVLGRVDCLHVAAAAFTNLTQDHLDFHTDMDDYYEAKRLLFTGQEGRREPPRVAAVNVDDEYGRRLLADLAEAGTETRIVTFSAGGADADMSATGLEFDASGATFTLHAEGGTHDVAVGLPGRFNVENALAALALSGGLGVALADAVAALRNAEPVPGRMEPIREGQDFAVLVDYAHTPDSLINVLEAARGLTAGRLLSVVGCGGDRDRAKRPLMGAAAAEASDVCFVTSDNPRSEDPDAIIAEVLTGIRDGSNVVVEADRRKAIAGALGQARSGDLVVIAGKGHEQGQEFEGGRKEPFDDREVAREALRELGVGAA